MKYLRIIFMLAVWLSPLGASAVDGEYYTLIFKDYGDNEHIPGSYDAALDREERLKYYAGDIYAEYQEELPIDVLTCAKTAVDILENTFPTASPIRVRIQYGRLPGRYSIYGEYHPVRTMTEVRYIYDRDEATCYPTSLYRQTHALSDDDGFDAVITISSSITWDCGHYKYHTFDGPNMTTMILRALVRGLGFGTAIDCHGAQPELALPAVTPYDRHVWFNDPDGGEAVSLASIAEGQGVGQNLTRYLTYDPYFRLENGYKYPLADSYSVLGESGLNSVTVYSLMGQLVFWGDIMQYVDEDALRMLECIGWSTARTHRLENVGATDDTGIPASGEFVFRSDTPGSVTGVSLAMNFRRKDGSMTANAPKTSYPCIFDIPSGEELSGYEVNVNGDVYGYVKGTVSYVDDSGKSVTVDESFRVSIPLKPEIQDLRIIDVNDGDPIARIIYRGTDKYCCALYKSDGNMIYDVSLREPFVAYRRLVIDKSFYPIRVEFRVENEKGTDKRTLDIQYSDVTGVDTVCADVAQADATVRLYRLDGTYVGEFADSGSLPKGLYIAVHYNGGNVVKREKIII